MTSPIFPAVGEDGRIQEKHLPERLTEEGLLAVIRREAATTGVASPGLDALAQKLAFGGAGNHTVAVVADSTMNDGNDSLRIFDRMYSAELADSVRHTYHNWNTADSTWRHTVNSEGDITPAHDGLVLEDSFDRVETDLVGSTPEVGAPWSGRPGTWSSDGQVARPTTSPAALSVDVGSKNMMVKTTVQMTTTEFNKSIRVYMGASSDVAQSGVMTSINVSSTGLASFRMYFGSTPIGEQIYGNALGMTNATASEQSVDVQVEIDIQNIKMTLTGPNGTPVVVNTVISEEEYATLGTWAGLHSIIAAPGGITVDSVEIRTAPSPEQGDSLDVWNGAIAGAKWQTFNQSKLAELFGGLDIDILMLSLGHNNGTQTGAEFVAEAEAWVDLWMSLHPETQSIIWVSQNPQFPPAASPAFHRDRQLAMRLASKRQGWEYVAGYEVFSRLADGGQSLVLADGIHPTTPPVGSMTGDYGAVLMAETIMGAIQARV